MRLRMQGDQIGRKFVVLGPAGMAIFNLKSSKNISVVNDLTGTNIIFNLSLFTTEIVHCSFRHSPSKLDYSYY
jgi:hypothetical protein